MKKQILQVVPLSAVIDAALDDAFVVHRFWEESDPPDFLARQAGRFEGLVTSAPAGAWSELIAALPNLKVIASRGIGLDKIDLECARQRGIQVGNTPGVLTDCVADLAFGLLIDVARGMSAADRFVRDGKWLSMKYPLTRRVSGKRLGIVGFGKIGRAIAKRASGFDMDIRYFNRTLAPDVDFVRESTVESLARWADFLVVAVAGGPETRHLISSEVIGALGPKGFLINIARGTVVDETALVQALVNGAIAGAGLDVFENEPDVPEALFNCENVVLLPHLASGTVDTRTAMEDLVLANLEAYFATGKVLTPAF